MIAARGVGKTFGGRAVLRDVTLDVPAGECLALLGANGAGKTTLLKVLDTLIRPTTGTLTVLGRDVAREPERVRGRIGFVGHGSYVYEDLTALENLTVWSALSNRPLGADALRAALAVVELDGVADQRARTFSAGMKRRLSLARFVHGGVRLLLLDEPFTGLDQRGWKWLEQFLLAFKDGGGTVVMATHDFGGSLDVADRVAILAEGTLTLDRERGCLAGEQALSDVHTGEA